MKARWQELAVHQITFKVSVLAEKNKCWHSSGFLLYPLYSVWISAKGTMSPTFRVDLSSPEFSGKVFKHTQRSVSQIILNLGKLAINRVMSTNISSFKPYLTGV